MKYIKLFEDFTGAEAHGSDSKAEQAAEAKINAMTTDQLTQAQKELQALASRLKITVADLADANKVQAALQKQPLNVSESVNEGLSEWWGKVKNTVGSWMTGIGVTGVIGSIITAAVGAGGSDAATNLADITGSTVQPGPVLVYAGVAALISIITLAIGNKLKNA